MKKLIAITVLILIGCSTSKNVFQNKRIFTLQNLDIEYAIKLEEKLNSEDISRDYRVELGKGIYPNINNYDFETSKDYRRIIKPDFSLDVNYHFTKDSLIRVIMYEWNELKKGEGFSYKSEKENTKTKRVFEKKFSDLRIRLNREFGKPTSIEMESEKPEQTGTYRNGIKWLNKNGINCYLFAFGNKEGTYNQIRLAIYPN